MIMPVVVNPMRHCKLAHAVFSWILLFGFVVSAGGQVAANPAPVTVTVVDENGAAVAGAQVIVLEPGRPEMRVSTDYSGRVTYLPEERSPTQFA